MKIYVTIQGPVSAMKSPTARMIKKAIEKVRPDLRCTVFDHGLFTSDYNFEAELRRVRQDAVNSQNDVCVIVIGTRTRDPLTIQIEPALPGASIIFKAVTDYLTGERETA